MSTEFYWIAVAIVAIVGSARITRLLTFDKFPPVAAVRDWYADKTDGNGWQLLVFCAYCMSFWVTAAVVTWADLSGVFDGPEHPSLWAQAWWFANGILAASYLAAMVQIHDGDES